MLRHKSTGYLSSTFESTIITTLRCIKLFFYALLKEGQAILVTMEQRSTPSAPARELADRRVRHPPPTQGAKSFSTAEAVQFKLVHHF